MKISSFLRITAPLLLAASAAYSGPVVYTRALPTGDSVNATGSERSNIKWAVDPAYGLIIGDDFTPSQSYVLDSLSVWVVTEDPATTNPSQELSSVSLYGSRDDQAYTTGLALLSSTYSWMLEPVPYFNDAREINQNVFKLTFSNLNWRVYENVLYDFALQGTSSNDRWLSLYATNAALAGATQDGADDLYLMFGSEDRTLQYVIDSSTYGWDKGSDINVELTGDLSSVPEPATIMLTGIGLIGAAILRKRRRR